MKRKSTFILFLITFMIPVVLGIFLHRGAKNGDWLQFWATYLGILFSVVLTLYVTIRQSEYDRENARSNHVSEIYLSTLIQMITELSDFSEAVNRLNIGISFKNNENYFYKYGRMSYAIEYIQNNNMKNINDKLFNLVAIIPDDRKPIILQSASNFSRTYFKIYNSELKNDWDAYNDVKNDVGRDNIDWFKEKLEQSHEEAVKICEEWLSQYKLMNKIVHDELKNVNYIYKN